MVNKLVERRSKIADTGSVLVIRRLDWWKSNGWGNILPGQRRVRRADSIPLLSLFVWFWFSFCLFVSLVGLPYFIFFYFLFFYFLLFYFILFYFILFYVTLFF